MPGVEVNDLVNEHNFLLTSRQYTQQYSHIYFCRLNQIKAAILKAAKCKWPTAVRLERTLDSTVGREFFVIGTLYNENPEKPSILNEIELEYHLKKVTGPKDSYYSTTENHWYLEDEHGRLELKFEHDSLNLITGMVMAVLGVELPNGLFFVKDWTLAGIPSAPKLPAQREDSWIVIASDLQFNCASASNSPLEFEMLKDCVLGNLAGFQDLPIEALVLCGNVLLEPERTVQEGQKTRFGAVNYKYNTRHFDLFDEGVCELLEANKHVILIPGSSDPTNISLPQQSIHKNLLGKTLQSKTEGFLHRTTNPAVFTINGIRFLATAGEALRDAARHSNPTISKEPLKLMNQLLEGRHLAPTAPDTLSKNFILNFVLILGCYPFFETDPFVLAEGECPHVLLCGEQTHFQTERISTNGPIVIMVPSFGKEHSVVLLNLKDFQFKIVRIDITP